MTANAFESGTRKSIPAVLVYARHAGEILMIHRGATASESSPRSADYHHGKWNGLGGKCEADESPLDSAVREFHEEAGLQLEPKVFRPLGVLTFPNFKAHKSEDWVVWVFTVELSASEVAKVWHDSAEGALHWIPVGDLLSLNLWPGDHYFLQYVAEVRPFVGTIWYREQLVVKHWVQKLPTELITV